MCSRLRTNRPRTCSSGGSGDYGASVTGVPYIYTHHGPVQFGPGERAEKDCIQIIPRVSELQGTRLRVYIRYIVLYIMLCVCAYYYCIRRAHLNTCMTYNNNKKKKYVCIFNGYKLVL